MRHLKLLFLLIPILFAFGLLLQPWGDDKHQEEPNKLNQSPKNNTQSVPETPTTGMARSDVFAKKGDEKTAQKQDSPNCEGWDSPSVKIQVGLLIVGIIYSIFAYLQWREILRQANIAESHLGSVERAWLSVHFNDPFRPEAGKANQVMLTIENTGHTLAKVKKVCANPGKWRGNVVPQYQFAWGMGVSLA